MKTDSRLCVGCNKCIFGCPSKANNAILEGGQNKIFVDDTLCIHCGVCLDVCDHGARILEDDTASFFADLESGKKIALIAAPSVKHNIAAYEKLFAYLQTKGVTFFYDVSLGADITTWGYLKIAKERDLSSMIAAPCPVVVEYIEHFKPELISSLAPIQSPAVCTAIYMKEYLGMTDEIAFLSPCMGKNIEFADRSTGGYVSYNVTYKKLLEYLEENQVDLEVYENKPFDSMPGSVGIAFSRPGGLGENVRFYLGEDTWIYQIEGMDRIKNYLDSYATRLAQGKALPFLIDALNCHDGCNFGTATRKDCSVDEANHRTNTLKKEVTQEAAEALFSYFDETLNLSRFMRSYRARGRAIEQAGFVEMEQVYQLLEKDTEEERNINCFSCGFGKCKEFVNAVALGKNHIENCFRYSYLKIFEQTDELFAQGQSLYEQGQLLEAKNQELTDAINYAKQMEESLKVEREINDFAVKTKYDLVSLIDVATGLFTAYKMGNEFERGGLMSESDYDAAATFVLENLVHEEDKETFKVLFYDPLISALNASGELILEYRLLDKDSNKYRWKRVIYRYFQESTGVIIQLTEDIHKDMMFKMELEAQNEKLLLNEECFKALSEQSNKVIFEWDFTKNKITSMSNFKGLFGREAVTQNSPEDALSVQAVHIEDRENFTGVFKEVLRGEGVNDARFRVADANGIYRWCTLSAVVIKDKNDQLFKAIAALENIDEQVQKEEELREKAEKDQLTELYNKATTEFLIKRGLQDRRNTDERHALMIIDIDNFKNVNDRLGHLYGDMVLSSLADKVKPIFREQDVIGRVGGDEFFIFMKNFTNISVVTARAEQICKLMRCTYVEGDATVSISASIGIAIAPEHGVDFDTLYKKADIALYHTKAKGKDNYSLYDGETTLCYQSSRTKIDSQGVTQKSFKENRVEYIFRLLYESDNEGGNIESVLQFITEHFDFSRGYVCEIDHTGLSISNTYEWCIEGVTSKMDDLQNVPIALVAAANASFQESGMFMIDQQSKVSQEERDILQQRGIKSMFRFGIMQRGELIGFVGFDDCEREHILEQTEIEDLNQICRVFATFLLKERAAALAQNNYKSMLTMLNASEGYVYVVDRDDYKILFENDNTRALTKCSNLGRYCYEAYMKKERPCDFCPIVALNENNVRSKKEIYNEHLDVYSRTTASYIDWMDGKRNYLITSIDITEYKK